MLQVVFTPSLPCRLYLVVCFKRFFRPVVMEKKLEELKQQLQKQCMINQELQRQNKDLGEYNSNCVPLKS